MSGGVPTADADGSLSGEGCPDRSVPAPDGWRPRRSAPGDPASSSAVERVIDGAAHHGDHCFTGDLFSGRTRNRAATTFSGTLDPVRDLLPAIEDQRTQVMPALDERGWIRPASSRRAQHAQPTQHLQQTQHVQQTQHARGAVRSFEATHPQLNTRARRAYGRHAAVSEGTPAEGFPRSLSWNGRIGTVRKEVPPDQTLEAGAVVDPGAGLIEPSEDPAVAPAFDHADGIVALWQGALGRTPAATPANAPAAAPTAAAPAAGDPTAGASAAAPAAGEGGLLAPDSVDLASGDLPMSSSRIHVVPEPTVSAVLSASARPPRPKPDVLPLRMPGDHQQQVDELPDLSRGIALTLDRGSEIPGISAPLPGLEDLAALGQQVSAPLSRITEALDGQHFAAQEPTPSRLPGFTDAPLRSSVVLREADELVAAVPERDRVLENPFRPDDARAIGGMSLPLLDGGWSRFRSAGGSTPSNVPTAPAWDTTDTLPVVSGV